MSGTDYVLKKHKNIDSTRMGLQGQSWGGYQTAQLITMTTRYRAAMAGAPVSNMFSAYGGIRWGSGLNRQFQYEHTQSRIGKTIWEAPELYVENSPLFHLPNVQTPLLIMHNDADGAVPWYQGIELFTGLKRLQKPVWMLNYNEDDHNLMKNANRMDLSIRMRQFFDFYLQGKPAPTWLSTGVPAIQKGKQSPLE
jgi:dipeptidyl aminopeptidase/acylaminoacyl peptidase